MLDFVALAGTAVTTILLPYLRDGATKFAATIAEKEGQGMGEYAAKLAGKVWDKVKSTFNSDSEQVVLQQFEEEPEAAAPLVETKLKKKLEQDPQLSQELNELVNTKTPDGKSTGAQIIGSSYFGFVDARGAHVSGANASITGAVFNLDSRAAASGIVQPSPKTTPQPTTKSDTDD